MFHVKAGLRGAVVLHNLGCSSTEPSPHQYGALLHTPGHVVLSPLLEGVGAGPGARGGAELLAAGLSLLFRITIPTTTGEEAVLGVVVSPHHQPGQLTGGGGGGEEHLHSVFSIIPPRYEDG